MSVETSSGYVECSECGHVLEQHDRHGCQAVEGCTCRVSWTLAAIRRVRRQHGLPGEWRNG